MDLFAVRRSFLHRLPFRRPVRRFALSAAVRFVAALRRPPLAAAVAEILGRLSGFCFHARIMH